MGEDEREIVYQLPRLRREILEYNLLASPVTTDCSKHTGEETRVAVSRDTKDIVKFLPGITDPGERDIPCDPGKCKRDDLLPACWERFPENRKQVVELLRQQGGISIFMDVPGKPHTPAFPRPFGNETVLFCETPNIGAHFFGGFGGLIVDAGRPIHVGFVLDILDLQTVKSRIMFTHKTTPSHNSGSVQEAGGTRTHDAVHHN